MTKDEPWTFKKAMNESTFTKEEYDRTRMIPERDKQTRIGKKAISAFIKSIDARFKVELSETDYDLFLHVPQIRYQHLLFMFTKYALNREIDVHVGANSRIVQIGMLTDRKDDDEIILLHNTANPRMYETVLFTINNAKRLLERTTPEKTK